MSQFVLLEFCLSLLNIFLNKRNIAVEVFIEFLEDVLQVSFVMVFVLTDMFSSQLFPFRTLQEREVTERLVYNVDFNLLWVLLVLTPNVGSVSLRVAQINELWAVLFAWGPVDLLLNEILNIDVGILFLFNNCMLLLGAIIRSSWALPVLVKQSDLIFQLGEDLITD